MASATDGATTAGNNGNGLKAEAGQGSAMRQAGGAAPIEVDASNANVTYANFCRITGTPEEVIIDFGLNQHPFGAQAVTVPASQRIVANYYTAKRLLQILHVTVKRYEETFGPLQTDVQRRALPEATRPAAS